MFLEVLITAYIIVLQNKSIIYLYFFRIST